MSALTDGTIEIIGRLREASNQTFAVRLVSGSGEQLAVYKPVSGETPLWDFPDGTLAAREYAAFLVSETLGWGVVPPTVLRDGPHGRGMLQTWIERNEDEPVQVVRPGEHPGYLHVLDAEDQWGQPLSVVHENTGALRAIALFDLIVNNTDRKGSHVLPTAGGHRFGIDHGVCFHSEDKVRTVLWGWAGEDFTDSERLSMEALLHDPVLHEHLADLLAREEVRAFDRRCSRLLEVGQFPVPRGDWPPIPWPPL